MESCSRPPRRRSRGGVGVETSTRSLIDTLYRCLAMSCHFTVVLSFSDRIGAQMGVRCIVGSQPVELERSAVHERKPQKEGGSYGYGRDAF